jgi:hypothetical protein
MGDAGGCPLAPTRSSSAPAGLAGWRPECCLREPANVLLFSTPPPQNVESLVLPKQLMRRSLSSANAYPANFMYGFPYRSMFASVCLIRQRTCLAGTIQGE